MRLLLDAHVSGRRIAKRLRERGHDVHAADQDRSLDGWSDEELLDLATSENRILVTFNVADFPRIVQRWAAEGRIHTGCVIVVGIDHSEFGVVIRAIGEVLTRRPDPGDWREYTCFAVRAPG